MLWQFNSPGAIKASPSFHDGRVFVADYEGAMFCLDAETGKLLWRTNTTKVKPFGEGGFYSSPAVDFGRVYAARDDGTVFAFDERTGRVAWSFPTHNFVYGSPASRRSPERRRRSTSAPTTSTSTRLTRSTAGRRWKYDVGGPVPGHRDGDRPHRLHLELQDPRSDRHRRPHPQQDFELDQAGYTPVVSDGRRLYLIGYYELIGLEPKRG